MAEETPSPEKKDLGDILVEGDFVQPEVLEHIREVANRSNKKLTEVLLDEEVISPDTLATILSLQYNVPAIDLRHVQIQADAVALLPEEVAREHQVIPLTVEGDTLSVAMEDPENLWSLDELSRITKKRIKPVIPLGMSVSDAIGTNYRLTSQIEKQIGDVVKEAASKIDSEKVLASDAVKAAPIVQAIDMLLNQAVKDRASDIHIEPQEDHVKVRYRIDGVLHDVLRLPIGVHTALLTRIKVLSNLNIAERRIPQDGRFN